MPRYFLHLHSGTQTIRDDDGQEHPDAQSAYAEAIEAARWTMAEAVRTGHLDLNATFSIVDERGLEVDRLDFADAVEIRGSHAFFIRGIEDKQRRICEARDSIQRGLARQRRCIQANQDVIDRARRTLEAVASDDPFPSSLRARPSSQQLRP